MVGPSVARTTMTTTATRTRISAYSTKPWPFFANILCLLEEYEIIVTRLSPILLYKYAKRYPFWYLTFLRDLSGIFIPLLLSSKPISNISFSRKNRKQVIRNSQCKLNRLSKNPSSSIVVSRRREKLVLRVQLAVPGLLLTFQSPYKIYSILFIVIISGFHEKSRI